MSAYSQLAPSPSVGPSPPEPKFSLLKRSPSHSSSIPSNTTQTGFSSAANSHPPTPVDELIEPHEPHVVQELDPSSPIDPILVDALVKVQERVFLLKLDDACKKLVQDDSRTYLALLPMEFPSPLNSYQRLLVHKVGDLYRLRRSKEPTISSPSQLSNMQSSHIVLTKTAETTMPSVRLSNIAATTGPTSNLSAPQSSNPTPSLPIKIMPRASSTPSIHTRSISPVSNSDNTNNNSNNSTSTTSTTTNNCNTPEEKQSTTRLTYEERQAQYNDARKRIFSSSTTSSTNTPSQSAFSQSPNGSTSSNYSKTAYLRPSAPSFEPRTASAPPSSSTSPTSSSISLPPPANISNSSTSSPALSASEGTPFSSPRALLPTTSTISTDLEVSNYGYLKQMKTGPNSHDSTTSSTSSEIHQQQQQHSLQPTPSSYATKGVESPLSPPCPSSLGNQTLDSVDKNPTCSADAVGGGHSSGNTSRDTIMNSNDIQQRVTDSSSVSVSSPFFGHDHVKSAVSSSSSTPPLRPSSSSSSSQQQVHLQTGGEGSAASNVSMESSLKSIPSRKTSVSSLACSSSVSEEAPGEIRENNNNSTNNDVSISSSSSVRLSKAVVEGEDDNIMIEVDDIKCQQQQQRSSNSSRGTSATTTTTRTTTTATTVSSSSASSSTTSSSTRNINNNSKTLTTSSTKQLSSTEKLHPSLPSKPTWIVSDSRVDRQRRMSGSSAATSISAASGGRRGDYVRQQSLFHSADPSSQHHHQHAQHAQHHHHPTPPSVSTTSSSSSSPHRNTPHSHQHIYHSNRHNNTSTTSPTNRHHHQQHQHQQQHQHSQQNAYRPKHGSFHHHDGRPLSVSTSIMPSGGAGDGRPIYPGQMVQQHQAPPPHPHAPHQWQHPHQLPPPPPNVAAAAGLPTLSYPVTYPHPQSSMSPHPPPHQAFPQGYPPHPPHPHPHHPHQVGIDYSRQFPPSSTPPSAFYAYPGQPPPQMAAGPHMARVGPTESGTGATARQATMSPAYGPGIGPPQQGNGTIQGWPAAYAANWEAGDVSAAYGDGSMIPVNAAAAGGWWGPPGSQQPPPPPPGTRMATAPHHHHHSHPHHTHYPHQHHHQHHPVSTPQQMVAAAYVIPGEPIDGGYDFDVRRPIPRSTELYDPKSATSGNSSSTNVNSSGSGGTSNGTSTVRQSFLSSTKQQQQQPQHSGNSGGSSTEATDGNNAPTRIEKDQIKKEDTEGGRTVDEQPDQGSSNKSNDNNRKNDDDLNDKNIVGIRRSSSDSNLTRQ